MASKWSINIDNFLGGFTPAYFEDDYPAFGNKNMAGKIARTTYLINRQQTRD